MQFEQRSEPRGRKSMDLKFLPNKSMTKESRRDKTAVLYSATFSLINACCFSSASKTKPVEFNQNTRAIMYLPLIIRSYVVRK